MEFPVVDLASAWADGALGAAIVSGLAALAMVGCGQPARRCALARGAILGSLAVLPLAVWAPLPRLRVAAYLAAIVPPRSSEGSLPPSEIEIPEPYRKLLIVSTLFGTSVGLASLVAGGLATGRLVRKTVEPSPETDEVYRSLSFFSAWPRPRLRVSARVRAPVLVGAFRPTILIPPEWDEPGGDSALRLGLLHEMAHAEGFDSLFGLVSGLSGALWFFLPTLWWVRAQMRLDQEFLADLLASRRFGPRTSYASSLLGLAQADASSSGAPGSAPTLGGPALSLRVLMLVRCPYPVEPRPPRWWRLACPIALASLTVVGSTISLRGIEASPRVAPVRSCPVPGPRHGLVEIALLKIPVRKPGSDGRVLAYSLFPALPDRFEMVLDVWASRADLPEIAIAGRFLGAAGPSTDGEDRGERYHRVRMVRNHRALALWVDGRPILPRAEDSPPPPFLSVLPAEGLPGIYRSLVLTW